MLLGVLSDTHGQAERAARAVALLRERGAEHLVHCGDVGGDRVLDVLAGSACSLVWGNTDDAGPALENYARMLGISVPAAIPLRLEFDDQRVLAFHGHEPEFARTLRDLQTPEQSSAAPRVDYILHGHTHVAADSRIGHTRIINPGALHRATRFTVALLDLNADDLRFLDVAR